MGSASNDAPDASVLPVKIVLLHLSKVPHWHHCYLWSHTALNLRQYLHFPVPRYSIPRWSVDWSEYSPDHYCQQLCFFQTGTGQSYSSWTASRMEVQLRAVDSPCCATTASSEPVCSEECFQLLHSAHSRLMCLLPDYSGQIAHSNWSQWRFGLHCYVGAGY